MKKLSLKMISLVIALISAVLCLGACGNGSAIAESIETCPIPAELTFDDLCGLLYIYGHQVIMPCTMEDIIALDERITRHEKFSTSLSFSTDKDVSCMYLQDSGVTDSSYYKSETLMISDETYNTDIFAINGNKKFGSDISEIRALLGEPLEDIPDVPDKGCRQFNYAFTEGDSIVRLWLDFDRSGGLYSIMIMHTKWTKI